MEELGLMERFADPVLFESLTLGEKTAGGLVTTLMGMGTTFVILVLLWGIIVFISGLIKKSETKINAPAQPAEPIAVISAAEAAVSQPVAGSAPVDSGQELIAVIMAAIAASQGDGAGDGMVPRLKIQKIQRVSGSRTAWNAAGAADCIESRKL